MKIRRSGKGQRQGWGTESRTDSEVSGLGPQTKGQKTATHVRATTPVEKVRLRWNIRAKLSRECVRVCVWARAYDGIHLSEQLSKDSIHGTIFNFLISDSLQNSLRQLETSTATALWRLQLEKTRKQVKILPYIIPAAADREVRLMCTPESRPSVFWVLFCFVFSLNRRESSVNSTAVPESGLTHVSIIMHFSFFVNVKYIGSLHSWNFFFPPEQDYSSSDVFLQKYF